ncbi:MAG TPA: hypothetical protein VFI87_03490 [Hyphomicrobiaceae bacterium]|nr:hypothetical protein [Hyphomicrobiaceae bacterium]
MKSWVLAVGLLAAAFVPAATAADVGDDREGYNDPRYRTPPAYNDRDEDDDDDRQPPAGRKYSGPAPYGQACAKSEQVRTQLTDMGWRDFHGGQSQGEIVTLRARRPNGRLFELTMHRCTGQIVEARPLEPRPFGPYAFNRPVPAPDAYDYRVPRRGLYGDRWREDDTYAYRSPRWWNRGY